MSEIGLFRRLPGTDLFATRVKSGSTIELGENVELRSIVRKGDGKKLKQHVKNNMYIKDLNAKIDK